jgi:hypothetical protein
MHRAFPNERGNRMTGTLKIHALVMLARLLVFVGAALAAS